MWIVEQRDPSGRWFLRATLDEQLGAEHYARLYKANNLNLRFRYRHVDEDGEAVDDSEPTEVFDMLAAAHGIDESDLVVSLSDELRNAPTDER